MKNLEEKFFTIKSTSEDEQSMIPRDICIDSLYIKQPEKGYRFSMDALLLANHVNPRGNQRILDLGTGCGVIALIVARRFPHVKLYGVEIQESLARLAHFNVYKNRLERQIKVICADMNCLCEKDIEGPVDMVVVNPPFGEGGHSRIGPNFEKNVAKHEIFSTLSDVIRFSVRVLKVSGTLLMIYPARRLTSLFHKLRVSRLEPKWLRAIHSHHQSDAKRLIIKAVKHGKEGITINSPLFVHRADGSYTNEIEKVLKA